MIDDRSTARDELVADLMTAGQELSAAAVFFHSRVAEVLGLGPTDTKALDLLSRHGALTPKRIGELTGLAPASITSMVDRLQRRGFVERRAHPEDGRRVLIVVIPTALGPAMTPLFSEFVGSLHELYDELDDRALRLVAYVFREAARRQMEAARNLPVDTNP